jgi:parallel beta-helix repeat protein
MLSTACTSDPTGAPPRAGPRVGAPERPDVKATIITCAATLMTDLRLESDLVCPGDAIFVGADDISIDLNGHTISGAGAGVGITVRSRQRVAIRGGLVRGFVTGIFVTSSSDIVISHNALTQNREAIFLAGSSSNVVKNNIAWENQLRGIMIRPTGAGALSTDNFVVENVLLDNPSGILLFGQPGNTLTANKISGSSVAAIDLTGGGASGNVVRGNRLSEGATGIKLGPGWIGNEFFGNAIAGNVCGTQGNTTGNTLQGNNFLRNIADTCP